MRIMNNTAFIPLGGIPRQLAAGGRQVEGVGYSYDETHPQRA